MLLYTDSCGDHYNTSQILDKWDSLADSSLWSIVSGRHGSCLKLIQPASIVFNAGSQYYLGRSLGGNYSRLITGFALKLDNLYGIPTPASLWCDVFSYYDVAAPQIRIQVDQAGHLSIVTGTVAGTLRATSTQSIPLSNWVYVEVDAQFSTTSGTVNVYVDNVLWITWTGVTSSSSHSYANRITFGKTEFVINISSNDTPGFSIDDLYVIDTSGSYNNIRLGDTAVTVLFPSASGDSTQWLPTGVGSNWQAGADNPADVTKYIASTTANDLDLYNFDNTSIPGQILAVVPVPHMYKSNSQSRVVHTVVKSAGVSQESVDNNLLMSARFYPNIFETDPATGLPWLTTAVDAMQVGPKLIS